LGQDIEVLLGAYQCGVAQIGVPVPVELGEVTLGLEGKASPV